MATPVAQFVSNETSVLDVQQSDFFDSIALAYNDYTFTMPWDINQIFEHLRLKRPVTDADDVTDSDLAQGTTDGDPDSLFHTAMMYVKREWAKNVYDVNGTLTGASYAKGGATASDTDLFGEEMTKVLKELFTHEGDTVGVNNGLGLEFKQSRVNDWLSTKNHTNNPNPSASFYNEVFTLSQVTNILHQIREYGRYASGDINGADYGHVELLEGDKIGVNVQLKTSEENLIDIRILLEHKKNSNNFNLGMAAYEHSLIATKNLGINYSAAFPAIYNAYVNDTTGNIKPSSFDMAAEIQYAEDSLYGIVDSGLWNVNAL